MERTKETSKGTVYQVLKLITPLYLKELRDIKVSDFLENFLPTDDPEIGKQLTKNFHTFKRLLEICRACPTTLVLNEAVSVLFSKFSGPLSNDFIETHEQLEGLFSELTDNVLLLSEQRLLNLCDIANNFLYAAARKRVTSTSEFIKVGGKLYSILMSSLQKNKDQLSLRDVLLSEILSELNGMKILAIENPDFTERITNYVDLLQNILISENKLAFENLLNFERNFLND